MCRAQERVPIPVTDTPAHTPPLPTRLRCPHASTAHLCTPLPVLGASCSRPSTPPHAHPVLCIHHYSRRYTAPPEGKLKTQSAIEAIYNGLAHREKDLIVSYATRLPTPPHHISHAATSHLPRRHISPPHLPPRHISHPCRRLSPPASSPSCSCPPSRTGVGNHQMMSCQFIRWTQPRQMITSGSLGTMGFGLPAAIGAQVACPDKTVLLVDGDGSFNMTLNDLGTVKEHQVTARRPRPQPAQPAPPLSLSLCSPGTNFHCALTHSMGA